MTRYSVIEVKNKAQNEAFIMCPVSLYRNEKKWIRPLNQDIEKVFDRKKNKYFRHGDATRFLLKDTENQTVVGRIAVFYDEKSAAKGNDQATGGLGFFECINEQEAANLLFDTAKEWLKTKGMEAMDGSINFGDRNENWGLLAEGFEYEPNYQMPWTFPYYLDLFENYGFQVYFKQFTFFRNVNMNNIAESSIAKAKRIKRNPDYRFEMIDKKNLNLYADYFREVYNDAWANFSGVGTLSRAHCYSIMKSLKPVIDERLMVFAFHKQRPIGFLLMIPELNQVFKHVNGKMNLIGKLKFLYYKKTVNKALGIVFGITPDFQAKGVEAALSMYFADIAMSKGFPYKTIELNWIGDFNPKMIHVVNQFGFEVKKVHNTYRFLFDREKEFRRMKAL